MRIEDVRRQVDQLWEETAVFWKDEIAEKYKTAVIDELERLLISMQASCDRMISVQKDALRRRDEMQE